MPIYIKFLIIILFPVFLFFSKNSNLFYLILTLFTLFLIYTFLIDFYYKKYIYEFIVYIINNKKLPPKIKRIKGIFEGIEELLIMLYDEISLKNYELREAAFRDPLTKFYNLLYLEEHLKDILSTFRGDDIPVFMIDIDYFKKINDNFGHIQGDHYLREFSNEIRNLLKESKNIIFRYGGDEFVIIFDEPFEKAKEVMENLRKYFENKEFFIEGKKVKTTLSIGGERFNWEEIKDIENILKKLDIKLYKAKEKRNTLYI
ncbi:MAG: GGDEF domain-containing protein [candidate division WOR-3 bacterium]